jgi:hypothetical protein
MKGNQVRSMGFCLQLGAHRSSVLGYHDLKGIFDFGQGKGCSGGGGEQQQSQQAGTQQNGCVRIIVKRGLVGSVTPYREWVKQRPHKCQQRGLVTLGFRVIYHLCK